MRRVLVLSPHFPPDTGAASHRMRLLAPHLPTHGWQPLLLVTDPRTSGARADPGLLDLVPPDLPVRRLPALGARRGRFAGVGDLGLRLLPSLVAACRDLARRARWDAVVITLPPHYPAVLAPWIRRTLRAPVVLDYQDPWVGAWGRSVGGGPGGRPDLRSRLSRWAGLLLEPVAVSGASGLAAVSAGTWEGILARCPRARRLPRAEIPLGGEPADFDRLREGAPPPPFDPADGRAHLVYVGTLLPLGVGNVRALFRALARIRASDPALYGRLRLHFYGTSNRTVGDPPPRALPLAREAGVEEVVEEVPVRIDYGAALQALRHATGILLLGSSERHYTASKIYPALLARRPFVAVVHEESPAARTLRAAYRGPGAHVLTVGDRPADDALVEGLASAVAAIARSPRPEPCPLDEAVLDGVLAGPLAGRLAALLDRVVAGEVRGA